MAAFQRLSSSCESQRAQKFLDELARLDHGHASFKTMVAANQSWLNADKFRFHDRTEEEVAKYHTALAEAASLYRGTWQAAPQFPEPCVQLLFIAPPGRHSRRPARVVRPRRGSSFVRSGLHALSHGAAQAQEASVRPPVRVWPRVAPRGAATAVAFELTETLFAAEQVLGHQANVYREAGVYQALTKLLDGAAQAVQRRQKQPRNTTVDRRDSHGDCLAYGTLRGCAKALPARFGKCPASAGPRAQNVWRRRRRESSPVWDRNA